jgi:ferrochelatase
MAERSPYVEQLNQSARLVAETLAHGRWSLAFQSRSGNPHERWLEPDISHALQKLAGRPTVIIPVGFLCDHVEVLYDLDIEAAKIAREAGVRLERAETVSTHPSFITMMAEIAISHCSRPSHCKNE